MRPSILLIEDNAGDSALVTQALQEITGEIGIVLAVDGELGLRVLRTMASKHELPDLIICNFNLPKLTGAQVLAEVKRDEALKKIPFIMLTSSARDTDRHACAGAKAYLIKGSTWDDTLAIAQQIVEFLPHSQKIKLKSELVLR
ncbi:MAG: response regulator [Planctomycetes bacterium]|nr:response regulator [Planctomycetota bacterium]